ncbi:MAG: FHA domain-containing protein [Firmicutes bacterium]|nr:FHA domain-containing protein [Bacillota bacterium]
MRIAAKITDNFNITFENAASMSYMVVETVTDQPILNYQIEMIEENNLRNVLPVNIRQKNGINYLYYNITSKMTLTQFLKRKQLKKEELIDLLSSVCKTLLDCKNYFLSDNQFVIENDFIYINPANLEVFLAYLPVAFQGNADEEYKEFVIDLITRTADIEESVNDHYLQKLLISLKAETFHLAAFQSMLEQLKNHAGGRSGIADNSDKEASPIDHKKEMSSTFSTPVISSQPEALRQSKKADADAAKPEPKAPLGVHIPPASNTSAGKKSSKQPTVGQTKKTGYKTGTIITAVVSQIVLAAAFIGAVASGAADSLGNDPVSVYGGFGMILLALDFLLLKHLLHPKNKIEKVMKTKETAHGANKIPKIKMTTKEIRNIPDVPQANDNIVQVESTTHSPGSQGHPLQERAHAEAAEHTDILSPSGTDETTILGQEAKQPPYLQGIKNGVMEQIPITKSSFIVGRLKEQVDYVSQKGTVGKVHAEIICRDGRYLLKDLNSRNGTYLNSVRIDSNKEYDITHNDKITFANDEYLFIIPSLEIQQ